MTKKKTYQFGILAEKITILFLSLKGYQILAWRYKTYFGEIDIVAKKGRTIVMVEVKARKARSAVEEVLKSKQIDRIKRAAESFLCKNPQFQNHSLRFDFVLVSKFLLPKHYKNFWQ